ncbi:MAG: helicase-exonuclease AddAB subunit AddA [Lachnospiraceae bacterium]|nr:helicase-exonuclease AddAB subunit AddA [Lachnospiraceae bacterium]
MAVQWTPEQKKVIESRNRNLLVAAAAGSGKTAVLVQHILELVTDPAHPVDVTQLLVVTFTRAAAAEMKERLRGKLGERLEEEPWNHHVRRQISLLDQAHISTIDSFCQWMVKNYFYRLDLDPDFRIPDEGEGKLLREEILDGFFEEGDEDYLRLMDAFGSGKGDDRVRELVEKLYLFADSAPWPDAWLHSRERSPAAGETLEEEEWIKGLAKELRETLKEYRVILAGAAETCEAEPGLEKYAQMFRLDLREVETCLSERETLSLLTHLGEIRFSRKPVISKKLVVDETLKAHMSALRDAVRDGIKRLQSRFAVADAEQTAAWIRAADRDRLALLRLTARFSEAYRQAKRERNLADFADIEHWALQLLVEPGEDGMPVSTPLVAELGDTFQEIIVDEYQDSNLVQETILRALSGEDRGHPNMFMVGDVKQSIYKFRMARPELFMEKYKRFSGEPLPSGQRIDLSRNFRSRGRILAETNRLFYRLMGERLGGVEYDESAALYCGASYPEPDEPVELLLAEQGETGAEAVELEGRLIAARIRELLDPGSGMKIWEEREQSYRPAQYRDIVILLRSMEGWADSLASILNQEGIPAFAQLKKGYFAAREVQVLLNFLRILDNPLQDIPLASVLLSPLGNFTQEELARMMAGTGEEELYHRCGQAAQWGRCTEKWNRFEDFLARYRREAVLRPIHEILEMVLEETDYGLILVAEPGGKVRQANVDMLMERAMAYEKSSYHGIFHFLRYMEKLQRYQVDYGEAQVLSENEDLVRITSIHKSKGLEYPIVIVAGMGKGFNLQDARGQVLLHEDLGLACDAIDLERRLVHPTLWKQVTADRIERDAKGEELRVLYVAMTRAKEKLILTGTCASRESVHDKWILADAAEPEETGKLPAFLVAQGGSYLDWIAMASRAETPGFIVRTTPAEELASEEAVRLEEQEQCRTEWQDVADSALWDAEFREEFEAICGYTYPWQSVCRRKAAWSVSELKKQAGEAREREEARKHPEEDSAAQPFPEEQASADSQTAESTTVSEPVWLGEDIQADHTTRPRTITGARRGTVYHTILERIPPEDGADVVKIAAQIARMEEEGILSGEEAAAVEIPAITGFYRSELGRKMIRAAGKGLLHREQPFVMAVPLAEVLPPEEHDVIPPEEWVLVQGIIDAFLEEEDGIVLWDYKTDAVPRRGGEEILLTRYREQLYLYRLALERARNRRVKEMWIYSFTLRRAIRVPEPADLDAERTSGEDGSRIKKSEDK